MGKVEIRGRGDRSCVFLHGMPGDRRVYRDLADLAPDGVTVVLVDLPDHGEADEESGPSIEPWERATREAVDAAPGDVTLVGHSVSGWLAAGISERLPERVGRFVAIGAMSEFLEEDLAWRRDLVAGIESGAVDTGRPLRDQILDAFFGNERSAELDAQMAPMLELSRERWLRLGRRVLSVAEEPPVHFQRPATIVHALGDRAVPFARGALLAERSRNARLVPIDTTSHMLPMTHAQELAAIVYSQA